MVSMVCRLVPMRAGCHYSCPEPAYPFSRPMLTDEQIQEIAIAHVRRVSGDLLPVRPVKLDDPPGIFFKVERPLAAKSTNLISPFLVFSADGRVIPISAGDVMPGIVNKLYGWAAMRADHELQ